MSKYSNKKALISTMVAMLMVLSAFLVMTGSASATASGTVTYNPTTFALTLPTGTSPTTYSTVKTIVVANGGNFGSGSTVYFYISTTTSSTGITSPFTNYVASYTLPGGATTLSNAVITFFSTTVSGVTPGTYYILASDSSSPTATGSQFTVAAQVQFVPYTPTITLSTTAAYVGQTVKVTGSGWDPGASVNVYLNYAGSQLLFSTTASSTGTINTNFVVPPLSGTDSYTQSSWGGSGTPTLISGLTPYNVVAQETNTFSTSYPEGGITASTQLEIYPSINVSPISTQGTAGSTFTINGNGFVSGQVITGYSSTSSGQCGITIGGVNTYYSTVTVGNDGSFSVTVILAAKITMTGGLPVTITLSNPSAVNTFYAVYLSIPGKTPALVLSPSSGSPGDPLQILVSGFPASSPVTVYFDSITISLTTDSNGFALYNTFIPIIPELPSGYTVFAVSQGIAASATLTITPSVTFTDSSGSPLKDEYAASGSVVTINAVGLPPYQESDVTDTGLSYGSSLGTAYYYYGYPVNIINGSYDQSTMEFVANAQGVLTLSYALHYSTNSATTGTLKTITLGYTSDYANYYKVGYASVSGLSSSYLPGGTVSLTVSNLIPSGSSLTPETAKYVGPFSIYIDTTLITLTSPSGKTTFTGSGTPAASASISFSIPSSITTGVHTLYVMSKMSSKLYKDYEFIVSSPSTATGTVVVNSALTDILGGSGTISDPFTGYSSLNSIEFDLYNFPASQQVSITVYTSSGYTPQSIGTTDTNGALTYEFDFPNSVGNIPYAIVFSAVTSTTPVQITGSTWYYEDVPVVSFIPAPFALNNYMPATDYYSYYYTYATPGSPVDFYAYSLLPNTVYNVYLSTSPSFTPADYAGYFVTDGIGYSEYSLTLPYTITNNTLYVDIAPASSTATATSLYLTVEVQPFMPAYAFPTEIITFNWPVEQTETTVGSLTIPTPHQPGTITPDHTIITYGQIYVTVYLNGTAYTTFPATYGVVGTTIYLNGSFVVPNAEPGTYWEITLGWSQNVYVGTYNVSSGIPNGTAPIFTNWIMPPSEAYTLTLVSGNGALMISISSQEIATIITNSINQAMQVPLSELNAVITSLNATVATISTKFGTMFATLDAINASVQSIANGMATVKTDLGTVQTSLANLNATVLGIANNVVLLNTALGEVKTTLNAINATLLSINNGVMTIQTAAGKLMASVSALNATVASINGNVATIMTDAGSMMASLSSIDAKLTSLNGNTATIMTSLGSVQTSLKSINATITSTASSVNSLVGSAATIQTTLGTISGTVTSVNNGVATIQTNLGTIQADVSSIKTTTSSTSSSVSSTLGWEIGVLVLVIITLVLVLIVILQVNRMSRQFKKEEKKTPEEKKEGQ
jgi:large-conductance mechanosensitive channel/archaellum component FlaC